jgi:hypothetical protein
MSRLQKDKINEIRSFLLLEQDKEINQIINTSHTRINGITSKEFMEKNKIEYEISINNGIIYDCYKLPKNEKMECNIFGKYCYNVQIDVDKFNKIKENKLDLALQKSINFEKFNKKACLIRKSNQNKSVKENINFLKRISFCLKDPIKDKLKYRKSVGDIPVKINEHFNFPFNSNSEYFPSKKKSTKNLKKYMVNIKSDKDLLKKIYDNYFLLKDIEIFPNL